MRFRSKLGLAFWLNFFTCSLWISTATMSIRRHPRSDVVSLQWICAITYLLLVLLNTAQYIFTWWDIRETGLFERRFWTTKSIPWSEIARIRPWQPYKRAIPNTIEIMYHRDPPLSDGGSLIANPASIPQFLEALQTLAPRAVYDL